MSYPIADLHRILFVDVETSNQYEQYHELGPELMHMWNQKMRNSKQSRSHTSSNTQYSTLDFEEAFYKKGAIYAEFAKVVCISVGFLNEKAGSYIFRSKSFADKDERLVLEGFHTLLNEYYYDKYNQFICGHNLKEFDIPFICRRSIINKLALPNLLKIAGYKTWQVHHLLDTMEMWKFGDYKHYTSLELLCNILNIDTPKDQMKGSDVNQAFWEGRLDEIATYCQKDVFATAQVYMKLLGIDTDIKEELILGSEEE